MPRKKGRKSTDAQLAAVKKYQARMAEIKIRCKPEEKEEIQKAAEAAGKSLNKYIMETMLQRIRKGTGSDPDPAPAEDMTEYERILQRVQKETQKRVRSHSNSIRKITEGR